MAAGDEPAGGLAALDPALVERARGAASIAALTGAGVSAASGIPTFRGAGGYWRGRDPLTLASPQGFASDPELVWSWYAERRARVDGAAPNPAHTALAVLEERLGPARFTLITQNVDGLHRRAGSRRLLELHGCLARARCAGACGRKWDWSLPLGALPPRCACGALARPDVVWFGEALDREMIDAAFRTAAAAGVLIVAGTSVVVEPAASLPRVTGARGGVVIEINPESTPLTAQAAVHLRGNAAELMPALVRMLWGAGTRRGESG